MEFPCFLYDQVNFYNLIYGSCAFSKLNLDIWKFLVHINLMLSKQDLKHDLTIMEMSAIVQWLAHSLVLPFLGTGMRIDLFKSYNH